jgi:hypothetical protein
LKKEKLRFSLFTYRMSLQSDHLEREYNSKIVSGRRQQDDVFCFLHFDSPKRVPWIAEMMRAAERHFGDLLSESDRERMRFIEAMPPHNAQYALWFGCLTVLPGMPSFLVSDTRQSNTGLLAQFLDQCVPDLVQGWIDGRFRDVHSWVRHARTSYAVSVPCLDYKNTHLPSSHPTERRLTQ